jgi:hypothetical protein
VVIASGHEPGVIGQIAAGLTKGTLFSRALLLGENRSPTASPGSPAKEARGQTNGVLPEGEQEHCIRTQVRGGRGEAVCVGLGGGAGVRL